MGHGHCCSLPSAFLQFLVNGFMKNVIICLGISHPVHNTFEPLIKNIFSNCQRKGGRGEESSFPVPGLGKKLSRWQVSAMTFFIYCILYLERMFSNCSTMTNQSQLLSDTAYFLLSLSVDLHWDLIWLCCPTWLNCPPLTCASLWNSRAEAGIEWVLLDRKGVLSPTSFYIYLFSMFLSASKTLNHSLKYRTSVFPTSYSSFSSLMTLLGKLLLCLLPWWDLRVWTSSLALIFQLHSACTILRVVSCSVLWWFIAHFHYF